MSFREKSAWISLLTYLGVYGYYFATVTHLAVIGQTSDPHVGRLLHPMFLLAVVEIGLNIVAAILSPKDARAAEDERERLIQLKATRVAFPVVMIGAAVGAAAIAYGAPRFYTANGVFLAIVLAQMAKSSAQIVYFRKGA